MTAIKKTLFAAVLLSVAAFFIPQAAIGLIPKVHTVHPSAYTFRESIPFSGVVTAANTASLSTVFPLIPSRVTVRIGDTVTVGDIVAEVDQKQTLRAVLALLPTVSVFGSETLSALYDFSKGRSLTEMTEAIPTVLTAPASGTVTGLTMQENAVITPGISCMTVSDCSKLSASLTTAENYADKLAVSDTVYLKSDAASGMIYTAVISSIDPTAAQTLSGTALKTTIGCSADFVDASGLKPGYSVHGIAYTNEKAVLLVPYSAVLQDDTGQYVLLWKESRAVKQPIESGEEYFECIEITSGLSPFDYVIVDAKPEWAGKQVRL